jgi:tubulin polyglutamylase TTLL4
MGINQNSVRHALKRAGFVLTERDNWNARWSRPLQCKNFKDLLPYQKLNHFPGTFELGRKDRLHRSLRRMQQRVGKEAMDFFPRCFLLPNELREFDEAFNADEKANNVLCLRRPSNAMRARMDCSAAHSPSLARQFARVTARCAVGTRGGSSCGRAHDASQVWILKPCASARGIGIKLITKLQQIPRLAKYKAHVSTGGSSANPPKPCLIQSYLGQPYLVDGLKFDLRIYVAITSYDPLRIYIYPEGLARFSTEKCVPHSVPILRGINPSIQGAPRFSLQCSSVRRAASASHCSL